ncbi:MAG: hypothetical protein L6428_00295 [Candidatus Aminicenantes bacterium]|nr:hypothetical protein [Acidobacteriota bacterium]MCG2809881.1 hypothetical protein [Candidatus Aminicenantes bacterium]
MNIFKNKRPITTALIFSTLMVLTHQHLPAVFTVDSLDTQTFIKEAVKKSCFLWGGFQLGAYDGEMLVIELSLSAQFSRKGYGSVYWLGGSEPFGNNSVNEYGFMVGRCFRTRKTFTGAAAGIGIASGWIGSSSRLQGVGVPLKLEGSLIIGSIMALNLQFRAFIWKQSYAGVSLGFQLGKLR